MNEYVVQLDEKSERELPRSFAIGRVVDFDKDGSPIHYNTRARVDAIGGVKIEARCHASLTKHGDLVLVPASGLHSPAGHPRESMNPWFKA